MKVKVQISSTGHLFGETFIIDVKNSRPVRQGQEEQDPLTLPEVAEYFMRYGVIVGNRWISPFRLMEFSPVEEAEMGGGAPLA